jgi:uncharacterized small protein (DUF1192 family)
MSTNDPTSPPSEESTTNGDDDSADEAQTDLHELIGELRAEITRLKAQ